MYTLYLYLSLVGEGVFALPVQVGEDAWQEGVAELLRARPRAYRLVRVDGRQGGGMRARDLKLL